MRRKQSRFTSVKAATTTFSRFMVDLSKSGFNGGSHGGGFTGVVVHGGGFINNSVFNRFLPAEPLFLRRKCHAGDRNPCLLSIVRRNKFVQLSFSRASSRSKKNALFKVFSAKKEHVHVVEGSKVDEIYDALVRRLLPSASVSSNPNHK